MEVNKEEGQERKGEKGRENGRVGEKNECSYLG